ncbi:S-adenosyl-L-methionine-dependent methyltransferase [Kockiozyma suomiensis]|uniref:S-adenosyl-L-methionine-dependent methyltransferase n=1 Tax=Kockiozyma suomiensis TaxID=1337062 RepID=UPI003343F4AE
MASKVEEDKWSPADYVTHASFVPALTNRVVSLLSPSAKDTILDIGCGDGVLTLQLATQCTHVHATDASANMVQSTRSRAQESNATNLSFEVVDAAKQISQQIPKGKYNKVFSNATYHWVFGSVSGTTERKQAVKAVYDILPSGGVFVAECGGQGNIAEILVALSSSVHGIWAERGIEYSYSDIREELWPWYFVSENELREWLVDAGFNVEVIETEYRPTTLNGGDNGMKGWLETFGFSFWQGLTEDEKWAAIDDAVDMLRGADWVEYSQTWVAGYVRCRFRAVKE